MHQLQRLFWLTGLFSVVLAAAAQADTLEVSAVSETEVISVEELEPSADLAPATTVEEWISQMEAPAPPPEAATDLAQALTEITNIQVSETADGLQLTLEAAAPLAEPQTSVVGNALTAEISNAVLSLPEGEVFEQFAPAAGIALVRVTELPDNRVQISITGTEAPPQAQISADAGILVLSVAPGVATATDTEDEAIQVVVTGEEDEGYNPSNASTATRTDTPLRDIPQSIQVVPRQVFEDQQAQDLQDVTRNVSGVNPGNSFGGALDRFLIRGFSTDVFLRDGFRDETQLVRETANLERVEVLKGPASVLFGFLEPGGIINLVTKQPLEEPFYAASFTGGSFATLNPSLDLSGPLNAEGTVLYRLNALVESREVFRDFDQDVERRFIAPTLTWRISDRTDITFNFEYLEDERPFDRGIVAFGDGIADIPFERTVNEPDDVTEAESFDASYRLEHRFSDSWRLRNNFRFSSGDSSFVFTAPDARVDEETGLVSREYGSNRLVEQNFSLQTNVIGEFATGSIEHTLLFGVDLFRDSRDFDNRFSEPGGAPPLNIFDPEYGVEPRPGRDELPRQVLANFQTDTLGIYLQDQIRLSEQWHLLAGGRFDIVDQRTELGGTFFPQGSESQQQQEAFSPRLGIVYQPIEPLSLYVSFTQSFVPNSSVDEDGNLLEPERGTQYEVGIKGDFLDGNLSATLAAFNIDKTNIAVADPTLNGVSRPIGEQRSRGIELDVRGEILPGWNVFGSYAYTDAEITEDDGSEVEGNRLFGVPEHAASLWTTYEIQEGDLQGLGFGAGLFFVGEREGDNDNSFQLPSYTRTDASIFYRRDNWRAGINFQNLFDIDYIESAAGQQGLANPGIPLTVLASFSVEF